MSRQHRTLRRELSQMQYLSGEEAARLAERYGVSEETVRNLWTRTLKAANHDRA